METPDELVNSICLLRSNKYYRVADIVFNRGFRWEDSAHNILERDEFKNTILRHYLERNKNFPKCDLSLLAEIIIEHQKSNGYRVPERNSAVVHIRAGDVVEHEWFMERNLINLLSQQSGMDRCYFVTSFAFQEWPERNAWMYSDEKFRINKEMMRNEFISILSQFPLVEFQVYSNENIDLDLTFMSFASKFIPDRGGFSELIEEVRPFIEDIRECP